MANLLSTTVTGGLNVSSLANIGSIVTSNGSATVPAFAFGAQTNTGIFLSGTNGLGLTVNGNLVMNVAQTVITVNTSMMHNGSVNVIGTLNVTANISNTGNLLVTQNIFAGNIAVTQNITAGNLIVTNPIKQFANVGVYVNGVAVANNPNLNFVSGNTSNVTVTGVSNTSPGNVSIYIDTLAAPGGGGGASPGGANTFIQFNDSGSFGGNAALTFNKANASVIVNGNISFTSGGTQYDNPSPMGVMYATSMRFLTHMGFPIF